jgi:3-oxoacyl-[acyl-carrier-protein] synthase III
MGTEVRYTRAEGERAHELCTQAGRRALHSAGLEPDEIDLLIYVGVGRGFLEPATANVFQDELGLTNATCFDVLDACASWLRAIHIARSFLQTGTYRNILIVNAEFNWNFECNELRSLEEFDYRFPSFTIGEAATATIVMASQRDDHSVTEFQSFGDQRAKCIIPLANWREYLGAPGDELEPMRFVSYGRDIMQFGLAKLIEQYRRDPRFSDGAPDIVFFHAASDGMARDGLRQCGLDESLGFYTHHRFANTVSAAIPLAMAAARKEGRLRDGDDVIVAIASAGISTGLTRFTFLE